MKLKRNGETLIETLIAVTILALITVPLLHPFVTAAKVNNKAKILQRSTDYSKNLMEKLKSDSLENVARKFSGYVRDSKGDRIYTDIADGSFEKDGVNYTYGEYILQNGTFREADDGTCSVKGGLDLLGNEISYFTGQTNENYCFIMPCVDVGNVNADVVISYEQYKAADMNNIYSMNRSDCAYFAETTLSASNAAEFFEVANQEYCSGGMSNKSITKDEALLLMTKTVTVLVEKDEFAGNTTVTVKYTYDIGSGYTGVDDRYYTDEMLIFDNYSTGKPLSAAYVYYFPFYGLSTAGRDRFIVENQDNIDFDMFFICMNNGDTSALNEANYKVSLSVNERPVSGVSRLYTNVHSNIDNIKWVKTSSNALANNRGWQVTDLGNAGEQQLAYNVTITVYRHRESCFYIQNGSRYFVPDSDAVICELSSVITDGSTKDTE